jgi:phosphohistidine phosphatase
MILYIMRHAEAVDGSDTLRDEWRYLTENGRSVAKKVAASLAACGPKPRLTVTSPLTRAVQTAEIAAEKSCRKNVVVASQLLLPGGDVAALASYLKGCREAKRVLVVGHEPQLGLLIAALLGRTGQAFALKKSGCVALKLDPDVQNKPAAFLWYLAPGRKRTTSLKKAFPHG